MTIRCAARVLGILIGLSAVPVLAADFSVSGFGTLGYARSNQPYTYQRFIDNGGTFSRDSVVGLQVDTKFSEQFGATVQFMAAPASDHDSRYQGAVSWAFLSWRPTNDWLIRAGKQRGPIYLFSQTYNVGVTYDFARPPTEMYSISPSNDFLGLSISKSWETENGDFSLDGYWGKADLDTRTWFRDGVPPSQIPGSFFRTLEVDGGGLALTYKRKEGSYRVGLGRFVVGEKILRNSYPVTYPFVALFPGVGYYQVDASLPGPGVPTLDRYNYTFVTLGADLELGSGFRVIGELADSFVSRTDLSTQSLRGYASVLKRVEKWTPYVTYAFLRSKSGPLDLREKVNGNTVPDFVPGAALINASQRAGADSILAYDQSSWAVGTSYSLSASSMVKAELMRVHVGRTSSLVDAPPGSNIRNQNINVLSMSYNFVF